MRGCSKVGCSREASATAGMRYREKVLWLRDLLEEPDPHFFELCGDQAERFSAPVGWHRVDERGVARVEPRREPAPKASKATQTRLTA